MIAKVIIILLVALDFGMVVRIKEYQAISKFNKPIQPKKGSNSFGRFLVLEDFLLEMSCMHDHVPS